MVQTTFNLTHPSNLMVSIVSGTIGAFGTPANVFLAVLILSEYKQRKPHEWLLFVLALNDFVFCLCNAALEAPFINDFETVGCKVAGLIEYISGTSAFFAPPLVAYNRYLSLYDTPRYKRVFTNRNVVFMWSAVSVFGFLWTSPYIITGSLGQDAMGLCGIQVKTLPFSVPVLVAGVFMMLSYALLLFSSIKVFTKIRNHKKQNSTTGGIQSRLIKESQELITAVLLISAIPLFFQMPSVMIQLLQGIMTQTFDPWITRIAIAPFPLTAALNPYITLYIIRDYRKKVKKIFKCSKLVEPENPVAGTGSS